MDCIKVISAWQRGHLRSVSGGSVSGVSSSRSRFEGVAYRGIKFFYTVTEPRDWSVLRKLRRPKQKTQPSVLTIDEVHQLIAAIKQHRNAAYFWTVYSLGLRLEEGLNLQVGDLDSQRMCEKKQKADVRLAPTGLLEQRI